MHIVVKVAKNKSIIDFKLFNHKVDRAVTYRELDKLVSNGGYDLVILEDIDEKKTDIIKKVAAQVRTALVCGRALEYAEQVNIAESLGIDIITQAGELDDYINRISGETIKFRGNTTKAEVEEYKDALDDNVADDDNEPGIVVEDATDDSVVDGSDNDDEVNKVAEYALNDVDKSSKSDDTVVNDSVLRDNVVITDDPIKQGFSAEILLDQIEQYKRQSRDFEKDIDKLTERLRAVESERDDLSDTVDDLRHKIDTYKDNIGDNSVKIESYVSELSSLRAENKELKNKIESLSKTVKTLQSSLNSETAQLSGEKNNLIEQLEECKKESSEIFNKYNNLVNRVIDTRGSVAEALRMTSDGADKSVDAETSDTQVILNAMENICKSFVKVYEENIKVQSEISALKGINENLTIQSGEQSSKIQQLNEKVALCEDLISDKDKTIEQQKNEINSFNERKAAEFRELTEKVNTNSSIVSGLRVELKSTKEELESKSRYASELSANIIELEKEISSKESEIATLNSDLQALKMTSDSTTGGTISLSKGYSGSARIIQVFGSGSYGVTTMAMTLSHRFIGKKVIFLDFDLVSPKADSWFGINPVCEALVDITNPVDKTGVAALLNRGTNYVIRNFDKIVKRRISQRDFVLDYFSGIYNTPLSSKIYSIDYSLLFNFLGDRYDYIVVDSGRIGSSDAYDSVIRTINDIAHKNVIITLSDKFDIRTQKVKMDYANIDINKCIWVMNMGDNNVISAEVKKMLGDIKMVKIAKVLNYYGIKKPMDIAVPMLKLKIDDIVKNICM